MNKFKPFTALILIFFFSPSLSNAVNETPKIDKPKEIVIQEKQIITPKVTSINFRNESLDAITKSMSKLTGKSFILTDNLANKKITIIAQEEVTIEEAYRAFLTALDMNELTVVPVGKFSKIVSSRDAPRMSLHTYGDKYAPSSDAYITRIHHLKYIKAQEVSNSLSSIVSPRMMVAHAPTNSLIITDTGSNINRIIEILEYLDVKGFEEKLEVIKIKHASAKDIAEQLNNFLDIKGQSRYPISGRFSPYPGETPSGGDVISTVIPDPRTNSIIVKATKEGILKIKEIIAKLDINVGGTGKIHIYYLQNSQAKKVSETLQKVIESGGPVRGISGSAPFSQSMGEFEGEVKITGDEETNSIVITSSLKDYEILKSIIQK